MENENNLENKTSNASQTSSDEKYIREDSEFGYTRNSTEIALLKASRKYETVNNNLLGNFDENGNYKISYSILEELIALKKVIVKKSDTECTAKTDYKDGTIFNFTLKFEPVNKENNTQTALLSLNETISKVNGYIKNTISTVVGFYNFKFDEFFYENALKAFHFVEKESDDSEGALKGPAKFIDARYDYLHAVKLASKEKYLGLEESYFNKRVQILNEIPQGAIILSEFNKKRVQLEKFFLMDKNKFRALNELLTSILEANPEVAQSMPAYDILMGSLNSKYLLTTREISEKIKSDEKVKETKQAQINLVEGKGVTISEMLVPSGKGKVAVGAPPKKKVASKSKSAGGGGGGGGKKGGGGGKKDKKKDKKKDDAKKKLLSPYTPSHQSISTNTEITDSRYVKAKYIQRLNSQQSKDLMGFRSWNNDENKKEQEGPSL